MKNYYKVLGGILIISAVLVCGWLVSNNQLKHECKTDLDCALAYTGSDICSPCDTSIEEYKCFPSKKAKQIEEEHFKKMIDSKIACEQCLGKPQHSCVCSNRRCDGCFAECLKIEKQSAQQITITTDKTGYEQGEAVKITIQNREEKEIDICGSSVCSMVGSFPTQIEKYESDAWVQKFITCPIVTQRIDMVG